MSSIATCTAVELIRLPPFLWLDPPIIYCLVIYGVMLLLVLDCRWLGQQLVYLCLPLPGMADIEPQFLSLLLNITNAASIYYTKAPKYSTSKYTTNVPEYYKCNRRREKVKQSVSDYLQRGNNNFCALFVINCILRRITSMQSRTHPHQRRQPAEG
ncbi:hypothetical protein DAPPUDRAFT_309696 [Daphnia pulex]|uniref:Uncharacterized protein n=1 Tax=Daphnia pulex TaxID=6669 RepID=E9FS96_DAPPU|nr:hypothetical protein DAPPUDRAFT_309696 [Daphnia pulex]|eukprot:EFX90360.1 hypothetical protein DAPPUDRAFT_309696 [Daphnia pulex]